jgi:hypothetical protein
MAIMYVPVLRSPIHVVLMSWEDWAIIVPVSFTGFITIEIVKLFFRRKRSKQS